jgi:hypothetical protein
VAAVSKAEEKLWRLTTDKGRQAAAYEVQLDALDEMIWRERCHQHEQIRRRLENIGINTANYRPPARPHPSQLHTRRHLQPGDDIERLVEEARAEERLRRLAADATTPGRPQREGNIYRPAIGRVLGIR